MKKYISYLGILILGIFSFYYTDKAIDIVKRNDPIMKKILSEKKDYNISSVNAKIEDDEIIPGINGINVNINKSYEKMKKYNTYDENMYVFEEIIPEVSLNNTYDKYITSGNELKEKVALIFKIGSNDYIKKINDILLDKMVVATFFIDGSIIEDNIKEIKELANNKNEIENLGFNNTYSVDRIEWTNNLIFSIVKKDPKFCYTEYKNIELLNLCSKHKMYTIKPSIIVNNYPFLTIKKNLKNGSIISLNTNNEVIKELPSIISYIKQKNYTLVTVDELLNEKTLE